MKHYTDKGDWFEELEPNSTEKKRFRVGLAIDAIKTLGPIVWLDLPQVDQILQKGEVAVVVESTKAAVDIGAPISGTVCAMNQALLGPQESNRAALNLDPEGEGWLYEVISDD